MVRTERFLEERINLGTQGGEVIAATLIEETRRVGMNLDKALINEALRRKVLDKVELARELDLNRPIDTRLRQGGAMEKVNVRAETAILNVNLLILMLTKRRHESHMDKDCKMSRRKASLKRCCHREKSKE